MTNIYIPTKSPEDWKAFLAEPEKHWKTGYSAKALAYCWQNSNGFPSDIKRVFKACEYPVFQNAEILLAIPEHQVPLPGGSAKSQNDIFVLAKGNGQLISITVEGKVSEPFGDLVSTWYKNPSAGKKERLAFLCKTLNLDINALGNIRYQLLHRTASAIIEAKRFTAPNALMLVHSFSQSNEWFEDYKAFAGLYGINAEVDAVYFAGEMDGVGLYLGWVKGDKKYLTV